MDYLGSINADVVAEFLPDYSAEPLLQPPVDTSHSNGVLMDNDVDLVDANTHASMNQWLVTFGDDYVVERPSTPADQEITRSYEKMAPMCVSCESCLPNHKIYALLTTSCAFLRIILIRGTSMILAHHYIT